MKLEEDTEDDYHSSKSVARLVYLESKAIEMVTKSYSCNIVEGIVYATSNTTLQSLLAEISPKLLGSLTLLLIRNRVISVVTGKPTALQVALSLRAKEKLMIRTLHELSVICYYYKLLRF